jgi:hypothetical protein
MSTRAPNWLSCLALLAAGPAQADLYYLIVGGLGGEPRYEELFADAASEMAEAARRTLGDDSRVALLSGSEATREALRERFAELSRQLQPSDRLAVFLVGHGSYDGEQYKFNLPGRDIDGAELSELLASVPARSQLIVNATSASGAVLQDWAAEDRIVITATRSGWERNATRFAQHWAAALSDGEADLNKNGVITAREAFEFTSRRVADSFESEGTLATEHPQLAGDAAERFEVARLRAAAAMTPELEALYDERSVIESRLEELRAGRDDLPTEEYLGTLEALLLELALVQERIDEAEGE